MSAPQPPLRFTGHKSLAHRLVLSTLTGRTLHISQIRPSSPTNPGLAPHEISLLRLFEAVTNGSHIEISYTGTILVYKPGLITGSAAGHGVSGGVLRHEVPATCARGIGYFLLPLCLLAPFSKASFNVLFTGPGVITSSTSTGDISVDSVRTAILPLYAHFGIDRNIELRVIQRANPGPRGKGGAGEVQLVFGQQIRLPKTLHLLNPGRVKKIRGVAYSTGTSGSKQRSHDRGCSRRPEPSRRRHVRLLRHVSRSIRPGARKEQSGCEEESRAGLRPVTCRRIIYRMPILRRHGFSAERRSTTGRYRPSMRHTSYLKVSPEAAVCRLKRRRPLLR